MKAKNILVRLCIVAFGCIAYFAGYSIGNKRYTEECVESNNDDTFEKGFKWGVSYTIAYLGLDEDVEEIQNDTYTMYSNDQKAPVFTGAEMSDKPIIYLYNYDGEVNVQLDKPNKLTVTYPDYREDGWTVYANTDGKLIEAETGKELYSLYYEAEASGVPDLFRSGDGVLISKRDTVEYLEKTLADLGLKYKEREEFIVYWLPRLNENEYNHIYFATSDEIKDCIEDITVTPGADQVLRVYMFYEKANADTKVNGQSINKIERDEDIRTLVEWGGTEVK